MSPGVNCLLSVTANGKKGGKTTLLAISELLLCTVRQGCMYSSLFMLPALCTLANLRPALRKLWLSRQWCCMSTTYCGRHNDGEYLYLCDSTCRLWKATGDTGSGFNSHDRYHLIWSAATILITSEQAILFNWRLILKMDKALSTVAIFQTKKTKVSVN